MTAPTALTRLTLPEMAPLLGTTVRDAERELEETPWHGTLLDATYADTHRFPPPDWALATFTAAAGGEGMTYTPYRGDQRVREAVATNVHEVLGFPAVTDREVILTPGTQGALFAALAAVLEPGDRVVLPDPDYLSTERMVRFFGAEVLRVPFVYGGSGRPSLDLDALTEAAAANPKLMIFSHPNNPTGQLYDDATLATIADLAGRHDFHVLADQLYCRLVYDDEPFTHLAGLEGMADRTITLLGPSKTESLSGFRIGVAVASAELVDRMEDVQSCTALRAPSYAQHLLARWLSDDQEFVADRIKEYQALRDMTVAALNSSSVMRVHPSRGSAYVFPEVLVEATDQEVAVRLKGEAGIVVNPGYQFGRAGIGHMRLCFAQDEAVWQNALDRIVSTVEDLGRR